jgi:RHS repeat-associated protein
MTTSGTKKVATTGSNHVMPGPTPAMSLGPGMTPAGVAVPTPYAYMAQSSTAKGTQTCLTVSSEPVLTVRSHMSIEKPGNDPAKMTGADVLTLVADAKAVMFTGTQGLTAGGNRICVTGDQGYMNVPIPESKVAQCAGTLFMADMVWASGADSAKFAAGRSFVIDPVSVASGAVCDEEIDVTLEGLIRVDWKRLYTSSGNQERTPLGRGGWTHSFHQWIEAGDDHLTLRDDDGRDVRLPSVGASNTSFHRGRRLDLVRRAEGQFELFSVRSRLTRIFKTDAGSGRAMLRAIQDPWGNRVELIYEGQLPVRVIGTSGREIRLTHDAKGRILRLEVWAAGATQRAISYGYDDYGNLDRVTDALGHVARYTYDGHHRMVMKTLPNGVAFHYEYDESGRCTKGWGDGGIHAGEIVYDLQKRTTTLTGSPVSRVFEWDERGAVTLQRTPDGSTVRRTAFDEDFYVVGVENAAGERHTYEYDARGNRLSHTDPDGAVTLCEYQGDLLTKRTLSDGRSSEFHYDARGALISIKYPSGCTMTIEYDGRGRIAAMYDPDGLHAAFEYDEQDNVVIEVGRMGDRTRFAHDPLGQITGITDALGRTVSYARDAEGRTVAVRFPDGAVVRKERNAMGQVIRSHDAMGGVVAREYAGTRSQRRITRADGQTWAMTYDTVERPRSLTNPKQETWELRYDRVGNVVEERAFDGRILRYRYSKSGALSRIENMDGTWRSFLTDANGALVEERSSHGSFKINLTPGAIERIVDEVPGKTVTLSELDALYRLSAETQDGLTIRYYYDSKNQRAARVMPGGELTRYSYDGDGRVVAIEHEGREIGFVRDAVGHEVRRHLHWNGVDVFSWFDLRDRLARQRVLPPRRVPGETRAPLIDRAFAYDARGWLRTIEDSLRGTSWYQHDPGGRLVAMHQGGRREIIDYDAAGSVIGIHDGASTPAPWAMRPGNVLVRTANAEYAYDEDRRRIRRSGRDGEIRYIWDCRGRLREARFPDGSRALYTYDTRGRRVRKEIVPPPPTSVEASPGVVRTTRYLWDGPALAAEIDSERGTRIFVHAPGTLSLVMHQEQGEVFAYINDHLGIPKELIDERGKIAWAATHSAWGSVVGYPVQAVNRARPPESPFRLLGHYHDDETGLGYAWHRYFDPGTARWLSPDPIGLDGGLNSAAFNGSPVVHVDPLGLRCVIGNPAFDKPLADLMVNVPEDPRYNDIIGHGSPDAVSVDEGDSEPDVPSDLRLRRRVDNWDMAENVQSKPDYDPKKPDRLLSCSTGKEGGTFAQWWANQTGKDVRAPNRDISKVEGHPDDPYMKPFSPNGPPAPRPPPNTTAPPAMVVPASVPAGEAPPMTKPGESPPPPALVPRPPPTTTDN